MSLCRTEVHSLTLSLPLHNPVCSSGGRVSPVSWAASYYCSEKGDGIDTEPAQFSVCHWQSPALWRSSLRIHSPRPEAAQVIWTSTQDTWGLAARRTVRKKCMSFLQLHWDWDDVCPWSRPLNSPFADTKASSEEEPGERLDPSPSLVRVFWQLEQNAADLFPQDYLAEINSITSGSCGSKTTRCNFSLVYQDICVGVRTDSF